MNEVINAFYTALGNRDASKMISYYHPDIIFTDPGFGELKGARACKMWQMLCENGKDLKIEFSNIVCDEKEGTAHWEAWYTFSKTGRLVHNKIDATFKFEQGKIIKHTDHFNLHKWASQAMGWKGRLLGGTNFFKRKLHQQTQKMLDQFQVN